MSEGPRPDAEPAGLGRGPTVAAVDLGSNSFHMVIARWLGHDLQVLDRLREPVRLAEGLDAERHLSADSQARALACLAQFGQRLRHLEPRYLRAVATNTFRRARGLGAFRPQAEAALGLPIEVLAGHEEARLIYLGIAQTSPFDARRRLVIDVGGGSTELIIGEGSESRLAFSRQMGCVAYSHRYFPEGRLSRHGWRAAETAAALELRPMREAMREAGWAACLGSSGTVLAIAQILAARGWGGPGITLDGLKRLRGELLAGGAARALVATGPAGTAVSADRWAVLPGGLAILIACFKSLHIESMQASSGALREGVLYDLLGRIQQQDARDRSVQRLVAQYHADGKQGTRVAHAAHRLLAEVAWAWELDREQSERLLGWAAALHEIGLAVAYTGYQHHGAYLIANSELPGFSADEQALLAALVRGHRRGLRAAALRELPGGGDRGLRLCILLRLAVLLYRSRQPEPLPALHLRADRATLRIAFPAGWLHRHPLTRADLAREATYLASQGLTLEWGELQSV
jgi:exopolyphosphatase/guanosine-5'-triphosphate,3'-diphosphate pyrophosphatase